MSDQKPSEGEGEGGREALAEEIEAQKRLDRIAGLIDGADDGEEPPTLRDIYLIAKGRIC